MNQEQLSLETCREIGPLFPDSRDVCFPAKQDYRDKYGWAYIRHSDDGAYNYSSREYAERQGFVNVCGHPSITDMMEWLRVRKSFITPILNKDGYYRLYFKHQLILEFKATTPIEAYAEAVKLVMGREDEVG